MSENRSHSPSATIVESSRAVIVVVALSFVAIAIACVALSLSVASMMVSESRYEQMDREIRLQRLETDELGAAVERAGIQTHREGDKP